MILLDPENFGGYLHRASVWDRKGEWGLALRDLDRAAELDPDQFPVYAARAEIRAGRRDWGGVTADCDAMIRLDPRAGGPYFLRGHARHERGEWLSALSDYDAAAERDPDAADAFGHRAWLLATCPDPAVRDGGRAVADATRACELGNWAVPAAVGTLGAALAECGRFEEAVRRQEEALADPRYAEEHGAGGRARLELYRAGRPYREPDPAGG